jgi:hypothetical protein
MEAYGESRYLIAHGSQQSQDGADVASLSDDITCLVHSPVPRMKTLNFPGKRFNFVVDHCVVRGHQTKRGYHSLDRSHYIRGNYWW